MLPNIIMDNAFTLQKELNQELAQGKGSGSKDFVFDFAKAPFLEPAGALMFSSIIRRFCEEHDGKDVNIKVKNAEMTTYGRTIGFFERSFPPNIKLPFSKDSGKGGPSYMPIEEVHATVINPIIQNWPEIDAAAIKLSEVLVQTPEDSKESENVVELKNADDIKEVFQFLLQEMLQNVPEHSGANKSWVCGQFYPEINEAEISVLDEGIGIYNSITATPDHEYIKKMGNYGALQWALVAGISGSFVLQFGQMSDDAFAGIGGGLYTISQICKELDGVFCMVSGENYIKVEYNKKQPTIGETAYFKGTAIRIRINLSKLENAKSFLKDIREKEANEAADVRKGFDNSAEPSQELIKKLGIQLKPKCK